MHVRLKIHIKKTLMLRISMNAIIWSVSFIFLENMCIIDNVFDINSTVK